MDRRCKFELIITPAHERVNPLQNAVIGPTHLKPDMEKTLQGSGFTLYNPTRILH